MGRRLETLKSGLILRFDPRYFHHSLASVTSIHILPFGHVNYVSFDRRICLVIMSPGDQDISFLKPFRR